MEEGKLAFLPGRTGEVLDSAVPVVVRGTAPVTESYVQLLTLQQNWRLFAPNPSRWTPSVEAILYYPVDPLAPDPGEGWSAERIRLPGGPETAVPRFGDHRERRLLLDAARGGWGVEFRPFLAAELCREAGGSEGREAGRAPVGVALEATWLPNPVPWWDEGLQWVEREALGVFPCPGGGDP